MINKPIIQLAMKRGDFVEMGGYRFEVKFADNEHGELRLKLIGPVVPKEPTAEPKEIEVA